MGSFGDVLISVPNRRLRLGRRHRFCDGDHGAPGEFTIV
jgi:hypothetical protein